jgi:acyl dehydratase
VFGHLAELADCVGQEIGLSDWLVVTQARIDGFAKATGDEQWIHVDPLRAATGPFGATVAHGFLTLSLVPALMATAFRVDDVRMGINYGLNRVRFIQPVRVGASLRGRFRLEAFEPLDSGAQLTTSVTLEMGGSDRPACVVEAVSRLFT